MANCIATITWNRGDAPFVDNKYSRGHTWRFDGGVEVPASSSPAVVPVPMSVEAAVDPEEAFVAALSSCHMLFFLAFAAKGGLVVDSYRDDAEGILARDASGGSSMTVVTLRPRVTFARDHRPTQAAFDALHHESHEKCFIARSVKTEVRCEPTFE
jgi:organic hydroperoxide reductase OsmC/OhrA